MSRRTTISLSGAGSGTFRRKRPKWLEAIWVAMEFMFLTNALQPSSRLRAVILRAFGARIGKSVILRPRLRVKYPWNLVIGDDCWIGEGVWIHNQDSVTIGSDTVISQETLITTGSHAFRSTMDLLVSPISIGSGVWITSRCIVLRGVKVADNVLVTPGSVVRTDMQEGCMYGGNPAELIGPRF